MLLSLYITITHIILNAYVFGQYADFKLKIIKFKIIKTLTKNL